MVLGDVVVEEIETADGKTHRVQVVAVEPNSDIAILGRLEAPEASKEAEAFSAFCQATEPIQLFVGELELFAPVDAFVFTHNKGIIPAKVQQVEHGAGSLSIEIPDGIDGGTSGGPVVTKEGLLLGIVSNSGGADGAAPHNGTMPRITAAAPLWLVRRMVPEETQAKLDAVLPPGKGPRASC
jgi:S1-C subfamily serine protease